MKEIYIVEDDTDIRELIEFLLQAQDYKVQSFATAEAFHQQMESGHPDLILLDIRLPDGNGSEMCAELKAAEKTSSIPIILMSAHIDKKSLRESCADDFVSKPFDIDELTDRIKRQVA